jgi:hypothetical protein
MMKCTLPLLIALTIGVNTLGGCATSATGTPQTPTPVDRFTESSNVIGSMTPTSSLREEGTLILWHESTERYQAVDPSSRGDVRVLSHHPDCAWEPLPRSTTVLCQPTGKPAYLLDILTDTTRELPIDKALWSTGSADGRYLLFARTGLNPGSQNILAYDLKADQLISLTAGLDAQNGKWLTLPSLAPDGHTILVVRHFAPFTSRIFQIKDRGAHYEQIGPDSPFSTGELAWSTDGKQLAYGATEISQEVWPKPNLIYVIAQVKGQARKLFTAPDWAYLVLLPSAWSPDGTKLAVGLLPWTSSGQSQLCLIDSRHDACLPATINGAGPSFGWSPNGERIAYVQPNGKLTLAKADGSNPITLLPSMDGHYIAWR